MVKKRDSFLFFCEGETKKLMPHIAKQVEILGNDKSKHTRDILFGDIVILMVR